MSVKLDISEKIIRELERAEAEAIELAETYAFGKYIQKPDGIYVKKDDALIKVANIKMVSVKMYFDELGLNDVKIDWEYFNLRNGRTRTLKMKSKREIESYLMSDIAFKSSNTIMPFIESVLHSDWENITIENGVFIDCFIMHDGKVVDNSENKTLEYTLKDIKEAIEMVNAIISNRGTAKDNDATVMRFMLWSPFSYCLKQIGFGKANYSLMLYGKPQTNKTGSVSNFSWFYSEPNDTDKAVDTLSVFGSRLEEDTLPTLMDESYHFLIDRKNHDAIKRSLYSKKTRGVKNKNNDGIDEPNAFSLPIFTYNEHIPIEAYFGRRFKLCSYDYSMQVSDKDKKAFDVEYVPESPKSKLIALRVLGKVFSERIIPYFERSDAKLMDIEKLTVDILKDIASDVGVGFDDAIYRIQDSNTDTLIDLKTEIKNNLNQLFRKSQFKHSQFSEYRPKDFVACANNGALPFLYCNAKEEFIIQTKSFVDTVSNLVNESLTLNEIMDYLELDTPETKTLTVNGKSIKGFKIDAVDLEWKVFGIKANGRDDSDYDCEWYCEYF